MASLNGNETLFVLGQVSVGDPAAIEFQITTQEIANLSEAGSSAVNVFTPEQFGAKGNAVGQNDGVISGAGFNKFSSASFPFTAAYVGAYLWFDTTDRLITSVDAGVATFSPAAAGTASSLQWLSGHDDTIAIQAALDAARDVQGDYVENSGNINELVNSGGTCQLQSGRAYIVGNSQTSYNNGKLSCLRVARRTDFIGSGMASQRSSLCLRPNSYGHMVAPTNPGFTDFSDFVSIGKMTLWGYREWSVNAGDGIYWFIAFNGYDKVDALNRFYDITVYNMIGNGFYFRGRGELIVENCLAAGNSNYGFYFDNQVDYHVIGCNSGGNSKTGIRINSSANGHWTNCKSFYSGTSGGTDDADCADWFLNADQMRNGLCYFANCESQESRGSGWYIRSGLNIFTNCISNDPGRITIGSGTVPTVRSGWYLSGGGASQNIFRACYTGPAVIIFNSHNWDGTNGVTIDGVDSNGFGPQENRGEFYTFVPTIKADGTLDPGTTYPPGSGPAGGSGYTNGRNYLLSINGVPFAPAVPAAVRNLAAQPVSGGATLSWDQLFSGGGISVTNYVIEYKLHADPTYTTFSHSPITAGPITVTGLTNNSFYDFRVSAVNSVGTGPTAVISNVQILVAAPSQVTGLVATGGAGFVGLTWTAPFNGNSPITDYFVEYKLTASPTWLTLPHTASALPTQYLIDVTAASYDFRVSAVNAIGTGTVSSTVSATPSLSVANFDASVSGSITQSGGAVSAFVDTSNGYSAGQATGTKQPLTGVDTINGRNAIKFDGTDDFLQATLPATGFLAGQDYVTLVSVMKSTGTTGTFIGIAYITNSGAYRLLDIEGTDNLLQSIGAMNGPGNQWVCSSTPTTIGGVVTLSAVRVRRTLQTTLYSSLTTPKNGGVSSNNSFTAITDQRIMIGCFNSSFGFFQGDLGQHTFFGGNISDADLNGIMNAMAYKWGATWTNI